MLIKVIHLLKEKKEGSIHTKKKEKKEGSIHTKKKKKGRIKRKP
jgi:hypothetical protein